MAVKNKVLAIPLTIFDAATLTDVGYVAMVTLPHPLFLVRIINESDLDLILSYDGAVNHDYIPAQAGGFPPSFLQLNFQTNAQPQTLIANLAQNTSIYGRLPIAGPAVGNIIIAGYYQPQAL